MSPKQQYMTRGDLAAYFGVSYQTIYRLWPKLVALGGVIRFGGQYLVPMITIRKFESENRVG